MKKMKIVKPTQAMSGTDTRRNLAVEWKGGAPSARAGCRGEYVRAGTVRP